MQKFNKLIAIGSICLAIASAFLALWFTPRATGMDATSAHLRTFSALLVTVTSVGGSILFLGGVAQFKTQLRVAYILFSIGIILFGIALLQLPIIGFLDLWNSWWANSGLVIVPFVFATALIYAGVRQFVLLLGIKTQFASWSRVIVVAAAATAIGFVTGHNFARYRDVAGTDTYIAVVGWSAVFITYAALLARKLVDRIGPFYQDAMRWLASSLTALTVAAWHEVAINYFMNNDSWYVAHGMSFWPFVVSGLLILRAGYAFTLLGKEVPYIPVERAPSDTIDVAYAASLASVAGLVSDKENPLAKEAQAAAVGLKSEQHIVEYYDKLEAYLMHNDPLRTFERSELRNRLAPGFRAIINQRTGTR